MSTKERTFWVCDVCEVEEVRVISVFQDGPPHDWWRIRGSKLVVCPKCLARFAKLIKIVTNELLKAQVSVATVYGYEPWDGDMILLKRSIKDTVIRTMIDFRSSHYTSPDMRCIIKKNAAKDAAAAADVAADAPAEEPKED